MDRKRQKCGLGYGANLEWLTGTFFGNFNQVQFKQIILFKVRTFKVP